MSYVFRQPMVKTDNLIALPEQTHRIYVVDCSGSMYGVMPRMKEQIKNKIPQLTHTGDTVSIVWFSSKGESGILLEGVEVNSITDFAKINSSIDRWLQALNLTGYLEPIQHVNDIIERLSKKYPSGSFSTLFFTDGYENQTRRSDLIEAIKKTKSDSFTFVEYGWYCDRNLLTEMAEACGGSVIFSESFNDYEETFETFMTKPVMSSKNVILTLQKPAKYGYVFYATPDEIRTFVVDGDDVCVPEYIDHVSYIVDGEVEDEGVSDVYAAIYTTAQKGLGNETYDLLRKTGDVKLVEEFTNCFSKQDYSEFQKSVKGAIFDPAKRGEKGIDFNCVPADDAYTVLDLLDEICSTGNKFHPYDPLFNYERISAKRAQKSSVLSEEDKNKLQAEMQEAIAAGNFAAINDMMDKLSGAASSVREYRFTPIGDNPGYETELTFNASRPNINLRFVAKGTVDIGKNEYGLPEDFPTRITRNYTVVKDGIKHSSLSCLPFSLTAQSYARLVSVGVIADSGYKEGEIYYINAKRLPVINRKMSTEVSACDFFGACVDRLLLQAEQKVYNTFMRADFPYVSEGFVEMYSAEAEQFLAGIGITEKNGFSPLTVSVKATDKYSAKEVSVKIEKCSSIPTINDKLFEKIKSGKKLTISESLVAPHVEVVMTFKDNKILSEASDSYRIWLEEKKKRTVTSIRAKTLAIAKYVFILTLSKTWFKEFSSMDENTMTIKRDGKDFVCSVDVKDIEIEI